MQGSLRSSLLGASCFIKPMAVIMQPSKQAAQIRLTEEELKMLSEVSRLPGEYPGWMLERQSEYRAHME